MGMKHLVAAAATLGLALALGACASDNIASNATAALPEKPKADPVCSSLAQKMDELRKDGVTQRVEQASSGKGTTVSVKRESLAKVTELNKASVEFQQKCSAYKPSPVAAAPAVAPTPPAAAAKVAKAAVPKAAKPAASATAKAEAAAAGIAMPAQKE